MLFRSNDTATTEIYTVSHTLSLHDALPILAGLAGVMAGPILSVQVGMGEQVLILTFVVVVIGGVGSIRGAFLGALVVGVVDTMLRAFLPGVLRQLMSGPDADALAAGLSAMGVYLLMAIVLLVKPKGLAPAHG